MNRLLRSVLFIPANNPGMISSSELLEADAIIYDLEDAISINQKDAARILLKEAFSFFQRSNCTRIVRVNPFDSIYFKDDIMVAKNLDIDYILLAKANVESVKALEKHLIDTNINIIVLIESVHSLYNLNDILTCSKLVKGLLFGAEDYSLDMQINRTKESDEILVARQNITIACKALNKFCIDTPFTDVDDVDYLIKDTNKAKNYGFDGKACINPRQVPIVNEIFSPTNEQISYALEVIQANNDAMEKGLGVFSLNGKMIDAPIVNRAKLVLEKAKKAGIKYE